MNQDRKHGAWMLAAVISQVCIRAAYVIISGFACRQQLGRVPSLCENVFPHWILA